MLVTDLNEENDDKLAPEQDDARFLDDPPEKDVPRCFLGSL
jgi:hypothetical protein